MLALLGWHSLRRLDLRPLQRQLADHPVRRGHARARAERGRVHGGDRARRNHFRAGRPDPRGAEPRDDETADDAADRAAAGDARDRPANRQRDDLDAEDNVPRQRDRAQPAGAPVRRAADLLGQLPDDPTPDRREPLVPDHDDAVDDRPVLPRALLRPRRHTRSAGYALATLPAEPPLSPRVRMSEPMVKAESFHKRFGRLEVLKGVTLEVAPGAAVC